MFSFFLKIWKLNEKMLSWYSYYYLAYPYDNWNEKAIVVSIKLDIERNNVNNPIENCYMASEARLRFTLMVLSSSLYLRRIAMLTNLLFL